MSAAQAVFHRRYEKEEMAQSSEQVCERTARLIELVELPSVMNIPRSYWRLLLQERAATKPFWNVGATILNNGRQSVRH